MQKKVEQFIERWNMISEGDKIVTGVSGGADSVCLLVLLDELCKQRNAGLYVVHVNHGIRGEAAGHDEEYVRSLCKEREIPLELVRADVPQIAKERKLSEEEAGRMIRREAFERVMEREQANKIAAPTVKKIITKNAFPKSPSALNRSTSDLYPRLLSHPFITISNLSNEKSFK